MMNRYVLMMILLSFSFAACASTEGDFPNLSLEHQSYPIISDQGAMIGSVPIENESLDRVEADIHPLTREAMVSVQHGRFGGSSLYWMDKEGNIQELVRTSTEESISRAVWSPDGSSFAYVLSKEPVWMDLESTPWLQFGGAVYLGSSAAETSKVSEIEDAARVVGFVDEQTLVVTRYLPGDLPEERPYRILLPSGNVTPILSPDDSDHFYDFALVGDKLFAVRSQDPVGSLPLPQQTVDLVEINPVSGSMGTVKAFTGVMPGNFRYDPQDAQIAFDLQGNPEIAQWTDDQPSRLPRLSPFETYSNALTIPYIHQVYDVPDGFNGHWACGPTSNLMAIQHFNRLEPWPITASRPTPHNSDYGAYISKVYTAYGTTFNKMQLDPSGRAGYGAWGWCTNGQGAVSSYMKDYAIRHNLQSDIDLSASFAEVEAALNAGKVVVLSTCLTSAGHIITVKGTTEDGKLLANDPYGDKNRGYVNYLGENVVYTWSQVCSKWFMTVYGDVGPVEDNSELIQDVTIPKGTKLQTGTAFNKTWKIKNTGTATWSSADNYGLQWVSGESFGAAGLIPLPTNVSVPSGAEYDWTVPMVTPTVPGSYSGSWRVIHNGVSFGASLPTEIVATPQDLDADGYASDVDCNDNDVNIHPNAKELCNDLDDDCDKTIDEGCLDNARFVSETIPDGTAFLPGKTFVKRWTMSNSGNTTWSQSRNYTWTFQRGTQFGATKDTLLPSTVTVVPGASYAWDVPMVAPTTPGTYRGYFRMMHNGKVFGNEVWIDIRVTNPIDNAYYVSETIPDNTHLSPGQTFLKRWNMKNAGNTTWSREGNYTWSFISGTQFVAAKDTYLPEGVLVASNATYGWEVPMVAPTTPGTYRGYWRMKHNGVAFGNLVWVQIVVDAKAPLLDTSGVETSDPAKVEGNDPQEQDFPELEDNVIGGGCASTQPADGWSLAFLGLMGLLLRRKPRFG